MEDAINELLKTNPHPFKPESVQEAFFNYNKWVSEEYEVFIFKKQKIKLFLILCLFLGCKLG